MYVATFTDGSTFEAAKYEVDDGTFKFLNANETVKRVAPQHSIRYVTSKGSSGDQGDGKQD